MKIRTGYVSNSSSSSFILDNKEDIKYFNEIYMNRNINLYETNEIKNTLKFFIKDYIKSYDFENESNNLKIDDLWNKYFEGKVPDYFKYHYINYWNIMEWSFSELKQLLKNLPDNKYLTDSIDRDDFSERCKIPEEKYIFFNVDL